MTQTNGYLQKGLSAEQVRRSRALHGENCLRQKKKKSFLRLFLSSFADPIIRILLGAVVLNLLISFPQVDWLESGGILAAVLVSTAVSAVSEYGSENAFCRLQESQKNVRCRVLRDGRLVSVSARELVVGDLVQMGAGERLMADGVLVAGGLRVDQSALNGESAEATKTPGRLPVERWDPADAHQLFSGSTVCSGQGWMSVCLVGEATLYGQIAGQVQEHSPDSPMRTRLRRLAEWVSRLGYVAAALVAVVRLVGNLWAGAPVGTSLLEALTFAITVLVVAVPEGLPMMITVVLSSNMKRMLRDKVLVRKPVGIETAGSIDVLFTDKTGTLTQGKMALEGMITPQGKYLRLEEVKKHRVWWENLCLSAVYDTAATLTAQGQVVGSTATDRAVLEGVLPLEQSLSDPVEGRLSFDSRHKYSAAWVRRQGQSQVFVKGAPDRLLPLVTHCLSSDGTRERFWDRAGLEQAWQEAAGRGGRVLLAAQGVGGEGGKSLPSQLTLLGLLVLSDPVRQDSPGAVRRVQGAGVQVVMVTGDHPHTACAIARACGIWRGEPQGLITGPELAQLSDRQLAQRLPDLRVVARAIPSHKSRLVRLAQAGGRVVGMTGDGINDAAALKLADVGFAMGSASEVAKEAGDIVITDDRFASVGQAVLYGRTLFKSIRKFVMFQFTMNLCAVGISLLGPLLGVAQPISVVQMLWVNMIMDTLGGIAFAGEAPREAYMAERPKGREAPILNRFMIRKILVSGLGTLGVSLWFLKSEGLRVFFGYYRDPRPFLTAFFATFIFAGIWQCFVMRSPRVHLLAGIIRNRAFLPVMAFIAAVQLVLIYAGGALFGTVALSESQLGVAVGISLSVFPLHALHALFRRLGGTAGDV